MKTPIVLAVGLVLSASAPALAQQHARVSAAFGIPSSAPRGDLQLDSFGVVDVGPQTNTNQRLDALHLRMTLTNSTLQPWTVDTREQRIDLEGYGSSAPAFASSDPGSAPPLVMIPPGGTRNVDLFYPLPTDLQDQEAVPSFDVLWRVHTDVGIVADRTPFENISLPPQVAYGAPYDEYPPPTYEWRAPSWYNPYYGQSGFVGRVVIPPVYFGGPLVLRRPSHHEHFVPRGQYHAGYPHERGYAPNYRRGEEHPRENPREPVRGTEHTAPPTRVAPQYTAPERTAPRRYPERTAPRAAPQRSAPAPQAPRAIPRTARPPERTAPMQAAPQRAVPQPQRAAPAPQRPPQPQHAAPQPQHPAPQNGNTQKRQRR